MKLLGSAHPLREKRQRRLFNLPVSEVATNAITLFVLGARKVLLGFHLPEVTSLFLSVPRGNTSKPGQPYKKKLGVGQDARRAANDAYFVPAGTELSGGMRDPFLTGRGGEALLGGRRGEE